MPAETAYTAQLGLGQLGVASSMYLKARNPKLLQKETFREKAYKLAKAKLGELKEKAKDWIPKPSPFPRPAMAYQTLENYVD